MRLLVTNTHAPPAYAVIRALRPRADRVVATIEGDGVLAGLAHAARSRLVDAVYRVPDLSNEWTSGRVSGDASPREQAFVDRMLEIVERERIDVIYPTWDPYVWVLAKHRAAFAARGVALPVPPFDTALVALDKYRSIQAAAAVGFPHPRTVLYESPAQAAGVAEAFGYPLVLKPRFTSGGHGMAIVRDRAELDALAPGVAAAHGAPMIQEYIPGGKRDSIQFVVGADGAILFVFHKRRDRTFRRTARFGTVSVSASPDPRAGRCEALIHHIGWTGAMGIETIHDPRDGVDKLMEVNPRFPRQVWNRTELGIDEPWMCVRIARGERVDPVPGYPLGVMFVSPIEDVQLFALQIVDRLAFVVRRLTGGRPPIDELTRPVPLTTEIRAFASTYRNPARKVWDPYSRHFFDDPVAALLWWTQCGTRMARSWRQLGK